MAKAGTSFAKKLALGAGAALLAAAIPSSVFAVGMLTDGGTFSERSSFAAFTPASGDPRLARIVAERSGGKTRMVRFTPAGANTPASDRSITVAVRVDRQDAQAISSRSSVDSARENTSTDSRLRIASTRYNLGLARGYESFAQASKAVSPGATAPVLSRSLSQAAIPDLSEFEPSAGAERSPSRFGARIAFDEAKAVRARQTANDQLLDVTGSYRVTRNLDVTAGVRYEQDRDLVPLPEMEQQDSQAVYVGTQFRF